MSSGLPPPPACPHLGAPDAPDLQGTWFGPAMLSKLLVMYALAATDRKLSRYPDSLLGASECASTLWNGCRAAARVLEPFMKHLEKLLTARASRSTRRSSRLPAAPTRPRYSRSGRWPRTGGAGPASRKGPGRVRSTARCRPSAALPGATAGPRRPPRPLPVCGRPPRHGPWSVQPPRPRPCRAWPPARTPWRHM